MVPFGFRAEEFPFKYRHVCGMPFGQGACLTCLLYVRDVQVFSEQSSMFFLEILFCRRSELA